MLNTNLILNSHEDVDSVAEDNQRQCWFYSAVNFKLLTQIHPINDEPSDHTTTKESYLDIKISPARVQLTAHPEIIEK